jgi:hypothetical protein
MPHGGRRNADQLLLTALACGATVEAAARQAGVGSATAQRRLKDRGFCRRLEQMRADLVQRAAGMLTGAAGEAVKTLVALMRETAPAAVRLGASRATLELAIKLREIDELGRRLAALEEQMAADQRAGGGR